MTTLELPARSELPVERTWDLYSLYPNDEAWTAALKGFVETTVPQLRSFQGTLNQGASQLADWLSAVDEANTEFSKIYMYAGLHQAQDTTDPASQARMGQMMAGYGQFVSTVAFSEPETLAIGESTVQGWLKSEPRLATYEQYFHDLFRKQKHVRSVEVEETLGMLSETLGSVSFTAQMLTDADMQFASATNAAGEKYPVAQGTLDGQAVHPDREVRRTAWQSQCDAYLALKNTLASNLLVNVKREVALARIRRFETALEGSLFQVNIPTEVFHNLIATFKKHIPLWHRYWAAKRRVLGVESLHHWDIWASLTPNRPKVSYEQAVDWISEGMKPLGKTYVDTVRRGCLTDRWVDYLPNKGKSQGAFSSGTKGTKPFILMTWEDSLLSMSTLAHELGHSMHSYLTWENQPFVYTNYSLFVAEVASNFNQALTRAYMFEANKDRDFQLSLIDEAMYNFHRYFFIMPTLARFELEVHTRVEQGNAPTTDQMIDLMADLFSEGYGPHMEVDRQREGITWAQFPHLYANFYVYAYATGISAANALAARVYTNKPNAAENYLKFLSAGSSVYPLDALKLAGIDMTTPTPIEEAFGVLGGIIERLESLA
jgi:oligoendopeptidase F